MHNEVRNRIDKSPVFSEFIHVFFFGRKIIGLILPTFIWFETTKMPGYYDINASSHNRCDRHETTILMRLRQDLSKFGFVKISKRPLPKYGIVFLKIEKERFLWRILNLDETKMVFKFSRNVSSKDHENYSIFFRIHS